MVTRVAAQVCAFDVNETLLDLAALDPIFFQMFGDTGSRREWFAQMLQSALVSTVTGRYTPFGTIAIAALEMLGARRGVALTDQIRKDLSHGMKHLPPHADVPSSLAKLKDARIPLCALTNSTLEVARAQLENAGLARYFDQVLSADEVKRLKPAPEPYLMAAERMGVDARNMLMIAAHAWDIAGALRAGCAAAFIARPGMVLDPLVEVPGLVAADLRELTERIVAQRTAPSET
jgi:2-haloacid dehalogenase